MSETHQSRVGFCDHFIESGDWGGTYCKLLAGHGGRHSALYASPPPKPNDLRPAPEAYEVRVKPHGGSAIAITGIRPLVVQDGVGFWGGHPLLLAVMDAIEELEGVAPEAWEHEDVDFAHWTISARRLPDAGRSNTQA